MPSPIWVTDKDRSASFCTYHLSLGMVLVGWGTVRATADGGAELAGDPKVNIFTE